MGNAYANYFSKTYIVCNRKKPKKKKKNTTVSLPGKTPLKTTPKSNNYHLVPAASTAGPCVTIISLVIAVLQACADEMITVYTLSD